MQADAGEKTADEEPRDRREEQDRVRLMTLHASKGLEFDTVFLIGVNQGLLPLQCRSIEQEERNAACSSWESRGRRTAWNFPGIRIRESPVCSENPEGICV